MPSPKRKRVQVRERKLGRYNALGMAWDWDDDNPLIEVDSRLRGKDRLTIVTHEALHIGMPGMSEKQVIRLAKVVASVLWADNYRRADQ